MFSSWYSKDVNIFIRDIQSKSVDGHVPRIGLLQQTITWYKIRHTGGQVHYYSRTGTLKQRDHNQSRLTCLCFNVPMRE